MTRQRLSTIGLIFITFLSAIQYVFLQNVPDSVSTFSFICITNLIGIVLLGITQIKRIRSIRKTTLKKGVLFAAELMGFNFFILLGSRNIDAVIASSVVSLYFVFITPLLLLLKKRVNFFSGIATVIAIVALILMFGADTSALFSSVNVVYLIIADIFFAAYVVSVSLLGDGEDSMQLTLSQMTFAALFAFAGWMIESLTGRSTMALPTDYRFWVSALFIGIFIRAVYGLIQITCQKYVPALNASLIFASEIIITLITNPIMCSLFGMEYTPATVFQIAGCILFIIATLMVDETFMGRMGYEDLNDTCYVNENGETVRQTSVSRKMILTTLTFSMITLILSTIICLSAIHFIRTSAVENSTRLGEDAANTSATAMTGELEQSITNQAEDKASLAEQKLAVYSDSILYAASYAESLYAGMGSYPDREVQRPKKENAGIWAMQRTLANTDISYQDLKEESRLLGNMADVFTPVVQGHDNIATIYLGTENGLLISYDQYSDSGNAVGESYYEYRDSVWYELGRNSEGYAFTDTYQDQYGRGLTITCVAPFRDSSGQFAGCVAMDILMKDLNESMVNDGIVDPSVATLIDDEGNIIASKDVDSTSSDVFNIFDPDREGPLGIAGEEILKNKDGITSTGEGRDAVYIAYATIDSTGWILCISNPVSAVIEPAVMIQESIQENTGKVVTSVEQGVLTVVQSCLVIIAIILIAVTLFTGKFSKRISDPLKRLEKDVKEISEGNFDRRTQVQTDDEIGNLARSFNHMTDSLQKYIVDLKEVTAKEERIAMELSVATHIQADMLPSKFPAFPDRKEFDIYATMTPAKEVGGDFYDFFLVDDDHLALVIADVSGKGVPAALFMVIAKTLIKNRTLMGGKLSPAEILADVNDQLCEGNEAELFVTVWLGILEISTGKGIAANAGHEHPALRRAGGRYELVVYRHSPAVAAMEGIRFREHEFELHPGDSLYVYTDGVAEATDAGNKLYGTDRMLEALNRNPDAAPEELLASVKDGIDAFVKDAPQFDDITMLGFTYFGANGPVQADGAGGASKAEPGAEAAAAIKEEMKAEAVAAIKTEPGADPAGKEAEA